MTEGSTEPPHTDRDHGGATPPLVAVVWASNRGNPAVVALGATTQSSTASWVSTQQVGPSVSEARDQSSVDVVESGMPGLANPPEPPPIERPLVEALIAWAKAESEWLQQDADEARSRGLTIHPQQIENIHGYQFMAEALDDSYDGYWD